MSRVVSIVPEFVETFPTQLEDGVLYVSAMYSTAAHLCCCGCGNEVITPLSRAHWVLTLDGHVSLRPSIGNWALPCRSHYFIDAGGVRWARRSTESEFENDRREDQRVLASARVGRSSWFTKLLRAARLWRR